MTTLIRRNINLMKVLCRWRLYLHTFPKEYSFSQPVIQSLKNNHINGSRYFATIHRFKTNNDSEGKENSEPFAYENISSKSVDEALVELDNIVQRTGRTIKKTIEKIVSMVESQGFASPTHGLYLLRACALMYNENPVQRVKFADEMWKKLKSLDCQFDIGHFNSLLRVYVENKHPFSPSEFFATMESHKIEPNKVTFVYLLDKYANEGNINGASEVLEFMKDKELPINETVFNTLIKAHMKANDTSGARDILEVMRSSYAPSANTYTALACGYAEHGDIEGVKSVFQEAKDNNVSLYVKHYLSIISSLPEEHADFVDRILARMDDIHGFRLNVLNCILDLISKDLDRTAYKLLLAISSREENNTTNNFIKQLIKMQKPVEKVIDYCDKIYSQQLNEFAFINAARAAIDFEMFDHAVALFEELNKRGFPIRVSFFWRLFAQNKDSEEGIWLTLKKMQELGIPPDFVTFEEYILPFISLNDCQAVLSKFQEIGISHVSVIDPLFAYYCSHGNLYNALYLIESYPVRVYTNFNLENFLSAYDGSRFDAQACCKILSHLMKSNKYLPGREADVLQGRQLALLIQMKPTLFQNFLRRQQEEQKEECKFNQRVIDIAWNILREKSPDRLMYIRALEGTQPAQKMGRGVPTEEYSIDGLYQHIREMNVEKVDQVKAELDKRGVTYPPVLYAHLLSLYCKVNNIEAADNSFNILKEKYPTFNLESFKVLAYAELLIRSSKFEEAKKIVANECQKLEIFGTKEGVLRAIKRVFFSAIETGDCDLVKSIQGSLMHHSKDFISHTLFYEPLLRVHIFRNDLESAVGEFRRCVLDHKVLPCINLIMRKCIVDDDQLNLQTVITIASGLVAEHTVLHELAVAFMDTGRKMQAMKVLQSLGSNVNPIYIEDICSRLYNQKKIVELEDFLYMVQNIQNLGKEKLFYNLFELYDERNDFKKAVELYKHIEKEQLFDPSDRMKKLLSNLLSQNGQTVPLSNMNTPTPVSAQNIPSVDEFLECMNKKNVSQALEKLQNMKKGVILSISPSDMSAFVDFLVQEKCATDLIENAQAMSCIIENAYNIIKPLLEKYSANSDIESLKGVASFLPDFTLKKISFNTYYAKCHLAGEKYEDLLLDLENNQANSNNKLFSITALEGLLKQSKFEERVVKLAKSYLDSNFDLPIAVLWAHYVTNEKYEAANELYKLHSIPVERVDSIVMKVVRQENNVHMGRMYIDAINQQNVRMRSQERAYGTLLDILVLKNQCDDAVTLLAEAKQKGINLEKYCRSTLVALRKALETENKEVPFTIPSEGFVI